MFFDFQWAETCKVIQQERRRQAQERGLARETKRKHQAAKQAHHMEANQAQAQPDPQANWSCACVPRVDQTRSALG